MGAIEKFKARRARRLMARGIRLDESDRAREHRKRLVRLDDEEQNNNNQGGGSKGGGSHGNTRLPFGLCKRFGIEIDPSWKPRDAWDALAGRGITPEKAFEALRKGEDPGAVGGKEEVKEPKTTLVSGNETYGELTGSYYSWMRKSEYPWVLKGRTDGGVRGLSIRFRTKTDLFSYLKDKGVEEFSDPETGEVVNPTEMEIPETVLKIRSGNIAEGYTSLSLGFRGGRYVLTGTDTDGEKTKIKDFSTKARAEEFVKLHGGKVEAIKISPTLKKRETERLGWLTSSKKEYFEKDGVKYGDVKIDALTSGYCLTGESESGEKKRIRYRTKTEAIRALKEQGVEKVRIGKETINPQEYKIPEIVATVGDKDYQEMLLTHDRTGRITLYGRDLDGFLEYITEPKYMESFSDFEKRVSNLGLSESQITIDDETKAAIAKRKEEDAERARRKAEFETKAETYGTARYMDIEVKEDDDGTLMVCGYTDSGSKRSLAWGEDWYDLKRSLKKYGKTEADLDRYIKSDEMRKSYNEYKEGLKEFESKAKTFGDTKYANVEVYYLGDQYIVMGVDEKGKKQEITREFSMGELEGTLSAYGYTVDEFKATDNAKKAMDAAKKAKEAIASGKYYALGKIEKAYTDIRIEQDWEGWKIFGTDTGGDEQEVETMDSWNDAVKKMSEYGVSSYKVKDKSGIEMGMPSMGMHSVMLMKKPDGGFSVYADTPSEMHKVMHEAKSEEEARKWLRENNVPDGSVKTRGMNPNDMVVRSVVPKALSKFDAHRMQAIEGTFIDDMSADEKQEVADMLQTVFTQGEYRAARSTKSFLGILENGYKSQIETGHGGSGAAQDILGRKNCSNGMYGHGGLDKTEYEVMGYAAPPDIADDYDSAIHPWYGGRSDLTYTFRKDTLKDRVTYTFGDSLNTYSRGRGELKSAGYAGENPTIEGMTGGGRYATKSAIKAYRNYKNGKINLSQLIRQVSSEANNNYIELQFTGGVTIKDIQKVSFDSEQKIRDAFEGMDADGRKKAIQLLKENKIELDYKANSRDKAFSDGWEWLKQRYPEEFTD